MRAFSKQLFSTIILILCVGSAHAQAPVRAVLLVHRITNTGEAEVKSVKAFCILPASNQYQEVIDLKIDPPPDQVQNDREGQQIITVSLGSVPPGRTASVRVMGWVRLKAVKVQLGRSTSDIDPLPEEVRRNYLKDEWILQLDKVRPVAEKAVGKMVRDVDKARALYDYMTEHCTYDIDKEADTADKVLQGKPASCSELAFAYLALCRSVGIPARCVSAYVNRQGNAPSADWRTHRWVEFYAEQIGWVPVDPTNKLNNPSKNFFGSQLAKYLAVVDDGVDSPPVADPAWGVMQVYAEPDARQLNLGRSAAWRVSNNRLQEAQFFEQACASLGNPDPVARREALIQWERDRHSMRMAFFLEALFDADADVRKTAAEIIGRSNDVSVMIALMEVAEQETNTAVKDSIIQAARNLLSTDDEQMRVIAVGELAKSRTDDALEILESIWKDESEEVRKTAAQMLYKFGDKPAVHEAYRQLTDDPDDFIRILAALRWARIGAQEGLEILVEYLASNVRWDREKALAELQKHTQDTFGFDPNRSSSTAKNAEAIEKFQDWLDHREKGK